MGYDVTFHPVSFDDLRRYLFDVLERPALAAERAAEISADSEKRRAIEGVYEQLADWSGQLASGQTLALNETFAFAAAQIAGFLYPFWYARNAAISMLDDEQVLELFVPLTKLKGAPDRLQSTEISAHIGLNYTAGGVIADVDELERSLRRLGLEGNEPLLFTVFDAAALASLRETIAYCREHNLALIEAADVVIPIADEARTDPDHYREAEEFDEPSAGERQWFEPPRQQQAPAFERLRSCAEPLANDTVVIKRLLGRNRRGIHVPLYLVPNLDRKKYLYTKYDAVLHDDGQIRPELRRRLKVIERASSHRDYRRRLFEYERSFYEEEAETHPGPDIETAQRSFGDIPERILESGLAAAAVGEWAIADGIFRNALLAADIIIGGKKAEQDEYSYPGNLAEVMRTRWFAGDLLGRSPEPETLADSCKIYRDYAESLSRSRWTEYSQRDYVDFVLTSLVAGRTDLALEMLDLRRPFDRQSELISVYRSVAAARRGSAEARVTLERCMQLLDVIRHPHGGRFLPSGRLTGIQLALATDMYLAEKPTWQSVRDIATWLGR